MKTNPFADATAVLLVLGAVLLFPGSARAHCDGMDGPVVKAARKALADGNADYVLVWVTKADEPEIRKAFDRARAVRELGVEARELADMYFFETLVRIHRAGEGAPYTGLKPAGRDLGPAIPLADEALSSGKVEPLADLLMGATRKGLSERFNQALHARDYEAADLEAGREFVKAYVTFVHYVERAYEAASEPLTGHFPESGHAERKQDR